jgi:hypothetical protein
MWLLLRWLEDLMAVCRHPPFIDFSDDSAGWYYYGPSEQGEMPAHPTMSSFSRASTLSLGSIAFGSLIVAILELIKMILNAVRNNANADGHRMSTVPPMIES